MDVVTRFAPSPTGMLHIGGARTALFNYLFAKHHNGKFLLRIEDTDRARSTPEATAAILEGMDWLGLTPDMPPVMQFDQSARHAEVAEEMIRRGTAFRCYATQEELQARRDLGEEKRAAARAEGISEDEKAVLLAEAHELLAPYRSPWRDGAPAPSPDAPFTVRLRAPDGGERLLEDGVQGTVRIQASELDDLILLRADGTPTYMLAVVVDDHDMGITHIIRGDDHLRNAFRQIPIYEAMGWDVPQMAHVPMIHGPDGAKLSKRHGALSTLAYREMGYLPEALRNYLLRLGWSHGDDEIIPTDKAVEWFNLDSVGKSAARFDFAKLESLNAHYIKEADDRELLDRTLPFLRDRHGLDIYHNDAVQERFMAAMPELKERAKTLVQLADESAFFAKTVPYEFDEKSRDILQGDAIQVLAAVLDGLEKHDAATLDADHVQQMCKGIADGLCGGKLGKVGMPLRAALTGTTVSPSVFHAVTILGRDESISRLRYALEKFGSGDKKESVAAH